MTATFMFCCGGEELSVHIAEVVDPQYGMYVWPSAPVLAQYVWNNRTSIEGKKILELGAGTALPGIVAAKCGADVVLSDDCQSPQCLQNARRSADLNGLQNVKVLGIRWGQFDPDLLELDPIDIILGSDCFYDTKDFEDIIVTVAFLMDKNPQAVFWTTYQERSCDRSIEYLLKKWGLRCSEVRLSDFGGDSPNIARSSLPGPHSILMLVIEKG
ncbi:histone-arginine methyltransferase METTL23-like [Lineus longissimus]|uniref:histone-arginine methyltransferase METTL23-like n=1 Tax=Lineus longissimus TaxID=88925 RepID=UPI002B4DE2BA